MRAGVAVVDISPQQLPAIQNGGLLKKVADQVLDPLHARTLVICDDSETIAIVIVDSCMLPRALCDEVKRRAFRQSGIPSNRILISATHTHSAPAAMQCLGCPEDAAYVRYLLDPIAQSIAIAQRRLQPAKVGWATVDASDLTNCRRWITRSDRMGLDPFGDRTVRATMHPGYQNPDYTVAAGPVDPWLSVLSVVAAADDSPLCVLGNLSMHYFGGPGISADYFGEVADLLDSSIGQSAGSSGQRFAGIMTQGTSGDLHWMDYGDTERQIDRSQYAKDVADRILQAQQTIRHQLDVSIGMAEQRLTVPRRLPSKKRLDWADSMTDARRGREPENLAEVYAQEAQWLQMHPEAEVVLQAVRIGELGITAISNEVFGITGLKLKQQSPLPATINITLAGGAEGYIPPPEQYTLGGYTTWPARTAGLSQSAEPMIVEEVLGLLETVSEKCRRPISHCPTEYSKLVTHLQPFAYWRLNDMDSEQATDITGRHHAQYRGGVALFLPATTRSAAPPPSNAAYAEPQRAVYLAGGHVEADVALAGRDVSVALWLCNAIPFDAKDTTGVVLSSDSFCLEIAGAAAGENAGKLVLRHGAVSTLGTRFLASNRWHHLVLTQHQVQLRVYVDGVEDARLTLPEMDNPQSRWLIGSDGNVKTTFDGKVCEVALFDRALSKTELDDLYTMFRRRCAR